MKTQKTYIIIATVTALALISGCNTINSNDQELTEEEIEMTGEIIAESLSDERGGLMSTFYDAFSQVSEEGINYGQIHTDSPVSGLLTAENTVNRGGESEWSAEYNPETGEHTISFRRSFEGPFVTKSLSVLNTYIFTDPDGEFLQFPRRQQDQIESIDFKGFKSGSVESARKSSNFTRIDTLFTSGLYSESPVLTLEGSHDGEGEMTVNLRRANGTSERSYQLRLNFLDIQIDKETVISNGSLEEGVTGLITYRMEFQAVSEGQTREKTVSGTIEMTGDGTALLRFDKVKDTLIIGLKNGELNL